MTVNRHLWASITTGIIAGLIAWLTVDVAMGLLIAWGVASTAFLAWTWGSIWSMDAATTAGVASVEDPKRAVRDVLLVGVAVASLVAVAFIVIPAGRVGAEHVVVGIACIISSWLMVHTVFVLKYASLYYAPPEGGIDFKQHDRPSYRDFAYVAFTIGMTFQVSDTDTQDPTIRETVLRHALISFLFGAVILAVTVNVVASLSR